MKRKIMIVEGCAFCLVFLFVYAATAKLFRLDLFTFQLNGYPWIRHLSGMLAWGVPSLELIAAGLLVAGRKRLAGFYVSLVLMILFTVYLTLMLATAKSLPCSCGGVIQGMSWHQHLLFNLFFIGISVLGIFYSSPKSSFYET